MLTAPGCLLIEFFRPNAVGEDTECREFPNISRDLLVDVRVLEAGGDNQINYDNGELADVSALDSKDSTY